MESFVKNFVKSFMNNFMKKLSHPPFVIAAGIILSGALLLSFFGNAVTAPPARAQPARAQFTLPTLPYDYGALEVAIDAQTMRLHHGKHHQAYIDKLNEEVAKDSTLAGKTLEEILAAVRDYNVTVRNNAGGHWNHSFFWTIMAPPESAGAPSAALTAALEKEFGSLAAFKAAFNKAGTDRFGSGWVWLIVDPAGRLKIVSTPNQDNPLMGDAPEKGTPVLGNDVWEHAYYLRYQNRRGDYMQGWWDVVNWERVSQLYQGAVK